MGIGNLANAHILIIRVTSRCALLFLLITLAGGCGARTLVALAPDPDGTTGRVSVGTSAGSVTLDTPYQASYSRDFAQPPDTPVNLGKDAVETIFAEALSIQPKKPQHFLLYFDRDTILTAVSLKLMPDIITAISERNSDDISVVGHTDTVGSREYNTTLSYSRAVAVKDMLVKMGVGSNIIRTTSHGKENLLIPTGDNVNEPRNRRVEVVVR